MNADAGSEFIAPSSQHPSHIPLHLERPGGAETVARQQAWSNSEPPMSGVLVSSSSPARFSLRRQLTRPHQLSMPGRSSLDPPWFISQPRRPTPQVDLPCDIAHPHGQVDPTGNGRGEALELRGRTNPRLTTLQDAPAGWARSLCLSIPGANSSHHRVWFLLWILAVAVNGSVTGHRLPSVTALDHLFTWRLIRMKQPRPAL